VGYYLETPDRFGKAESLVKMYGGRIVSRPEARDLVENRTKAVICVVYNPEFEAAAFCYAPKEFERFTHHADLRKRTWVVIDDRDMIEELTGYKEDMATIGEEE